MIFRAEVALILFLLCSSLAMSAEGDKRLLLIGQGSDGHKRTTHEFMAGIRVLKKCLQPVKGLQIDVAKADEPWAEGPDLLKKYDGVVIFVTQGARWMQNDPRRYDALTQLAQRGGGIICLHWAVGAQDGKYIDGQLKLLGGTRGGPQRKYKIVEADLTVADRKHPIVQGVKDFHARDEFYYRLDFVKGEPAIHPILTTKIDGQDETVAWSWKRKDGGRSFGFVGLHFHKNWGLVQYRKMVASAVLWTLKMPVPKGGLAVQITDDDLKLPPIAQPKKPSAVKSKK